MTPEQVAAMSDAELDKAVWRALEWVDKVGDDPTYKWFGQPKDFPDGWWNFNPPRPSTDWAFFGWLHEEMERRGYAAYATQFINVEQPEKGVTRIGGRAYILDTDTAQEPLIDQEERTAWEDPAHPHKFIRAMTESVLLALQEGNDGA